MKGLPFPLAKIFKPIFIHSSSQKWIYQQTCIVRLLIQRSSFSRPALHEVRTFPVLWCHLVRPWSLFHGYDSSPLVSPLWIASSLFDFVENIVFLKPLDKYLRWPCIVCTKCAQHILALTKTQNLVKTSPKGFPFVKQWTDCSNLKSQNVVEPKYHFRENILWSLTEWILQTVLY